MRLVDGDTYARYTGDRSTDAETVDEALDDATALLEERLQRPLALGARTERLKVAKAAWTGEHVVFPACVPLQSTSDGEIRGDAIVDVTVDGSPFAVGEWATVTYLGGFTPDTLPRSIARDIAACARQLIDVQTPAATPAVIPVGATSVKVGDAAVGFGPGGYTTATSVPGGFAWSPDTLRWRRRSL